jgi:hypothetical protein
MLYDIRLTLFAGFGLFVLISAWSEFLRKPTYHPPQVSPLPYTPSENSTPSTSNPRIPTQSYTSTRNSYVRPAYAPNGKPWPTKAGYLPDSAVLHSGGLSEVTVDNSQNSSDVFVKLMYISSRNPIEVRCFYIPAYSKFTCSDVIPGNYDVRYRDLNSGSLAKTEPFLLEEIKIGDSTQYSMLTMTLYKVENGNMQTKPITEADF